MALYWQDITHNGASKSYEKMREIVTLHLERKLLDKNQNAMSKSLQPQGSYGAAAKGKGRGKGKGKMKGTSGGPQKGKCHVWGKKGQCPRGQDCPWVDSHTDANKPQGRGRSQTTQGEGKGGRDKSQERGKSQERTRSPSCPPPKMGSLKGTAINGEADRPPCFKFLQHNCTKGDACNFWHSSPCKFLAEGRCAAEEN